MAELTEDQLKELELMTHPENWVHRPLLPLKKILSPGDREFGTLVEGILGRFLFYPGVTIFDTDKQKMEQAMKNGQMLLAPGLVDLVLAGWVVD